MRLSLIATLLLSTMLSACSTTQGNSHKDSPEYKAAEEIKRSGNTQAAANAWRRMVQADADDIESAIELSIAERKLGHAEDAAQFMADYNARFPNNAAILSQLGYALTDAGKTEEAVAAFEQAHMLQPQNPLYLSGKAIAFDKAGNHLAAQDIYKEALALSPDSVTIKNNLAMSLILNNEPKPAIDILEKLHEENASNQTVRQNLALAYGIKGDSKKALELNMKDLSSEEAQDNLRFYKKYMQLLKKKSSKTTSDSIGFSETTSDIKAKPIQKVEDTETKSKLKVTPLVVEETKDAPVTKEPPAKPTKPSKAKPAKIMQEESPEETTQPKVEEPVTPSLRVPETPTGTVLPTRSFEEKPEYPGQLR